MAEGEVGSVEQLLDKASGSLSERESSELKRILYGSPAEYVARLSLLPAAILQLHIHPHRELAVPEEAKRLAEEQNFELKSYRFGAAKEQTRAPRPVRIAVVQNAIVKPTTAPVTEQVCTVHCLTMQYGSIAACHLEGSSLAPYLHHYPCCIAVWCQHHLLSGGLE